MTQEWIRFWITAVLLVLGAGTLGCSVVGVFRFKNALNRMQSAAIGDSLAMLLVFAGLCVASGVGMDMLKLALTVVFLWCCSPISAHLVSYLVIRTQPEAADIPVLKLGKDKKEDKK